MTETELPRAARPITGGAARSAAGTFLSATAGALTTLILARILGPAGAGRYAVAMSLIMGLQTLGSLSLQNGIAYFVGRGTWSPRQAFAETQAAAVVLGLLSLLIAFGIRSLIPSAFHGLSVGLTMLAAASVPFALSWIFTAGVALATDRYELFALPSALQNGIALIAVLTLGALYGIPGALIGLTVSHVLTAFLCLWWCRRGLPVIYGQSRYPGLLRQALVFSVKTHVANSLTFVTFRLDIFILNSVAAAREVGQYAIAVAVTQAVWLLPAALSNVVMPRIAQVAAGQIAVEDDYQEMVERKGVRHATILAFLSGVGLVGVLVLLVLLVLGPQFHESISLGLILLPGSVLLAISTALVSVLSGRGRPGYTLLVSALTAPVAIGLYFWLIPVDGAVGAAVGSSLSYAFGFLVSVVLARRMLHRPMRPMIFPARAEITDYAALLSALSRRRAQHGAR